MKKTFTSLALALAFMCGSAHAITQEERDYAFVAITNMERVNGIEHEEVRAEVNRYSEAELRDYITQLIYKRSIDYGEDPYKLSLAQVRDNFKNTTFKEFAQLK